MKRRDDPNQTLIDWGNPQAPALAEEPAYPNPTKLVTQVAPSLVQHLSWDFKATFPQPTEEAIDAGHIMDEDCTPDHIQAIHEEHARHMSALLNDLDAVMDARRRGIDPATGKPPRTHATREKLRQRLAQEPDRIEREYRTMLGVYEEVFGPDAADAFDKALRAWHAGIPVEMQASTTQPADEQGPANPAPAPIHRVRTRRSSVMPVPRPLAAAIAAARFGHEDGKPVRPGVAEVRAISEQHTEKIIDLLDALDRAERSIELPHTDKGRLYVERDRLNGRLASELGRYAEDFGQPAAEQLERHARRKMKDDQRGR